MRIFRQFFELSDNSDRPQRLLPGTGRNLWALHFSVLRTELSDNWPKTRGIVRQLGKAWLYRAELSDNLPTMGGIVRQLEEAGFYRRKFSDNLPVCWSIVWQLKKAGLYTVFRQFNLGWGKWLFFLITNLASQIFWQLYHVCGNYQTIGKEWKRNWQTIK